MSFIRDLFLVSHVTKNDTIYQENVLLINNKGDNKKRIVAITLMHT